MATFYEELVIDVKIFKGKVLATGYDMGRICDRLRAALRAKGISKKRAASQMKVSRDLLSDYTSPEYPEKSMQVETLKRFAEYLGEETYYFCNEYHKFLDTTDIGDFLRKERKKRKMTREQFAAYLEISLSSYKSYESGRCKLPEHIFEKLKA